MPRISLEIKLCELCPTSSLQAAESGFLSLCLCVGYRSYVCECIYVNRKLWALEYLCYYFCSGTKVTAAHIALAQMETSGKCGNNSTAWDISGWYCSCVGVKMDWKCKYWLLQMKKS